MVFRYIRWYSSGSNANAGNHMVEVQAIDYSSGANHCAGKTFRGSNGATSTIPGNGSTSSDTFFDYGSGANQWMQVDLGANRSIKEIRTLHYYADYRVYYDCKILVSLDGTNWYKTTFDGGLQGDYYEHAYWHYTYTFDSYITPISTAVNLNSVKTGVEGGSASMGDARIRNASGDTSGAISMSQLRGISHRWWRNVRYSVTGNNNHPTTRNLDATTRTPSSVTRAFNGGASAGKYGTQRDVYGGWATFVATRRVETNVTTYRNVGDVMSTWYDGTYQMQRIVAARHISTQTYDNRYHYDAYDRRRTLTKYQHYAAVLRMT